MQISSFRTHDIAVTGIVVQACTHLEAQTQDETRYTTVIMQTTEQVSKGVTGQAKKQQNSS